MPGVKVPEEKKVMIWQGRTVDYRKNSGWNAWQDMVTVTGALHGQKVPVYENRCGQETWIGVLQGLTG